MEAVGRFESIHCEGDQSHVLRFSATVRGLDHRRSSLRVKSVTMAPPTTAAPPTERFETRL